MEPPAKRPRLSFHAPGCTVDEDDELSYEPEEICRLRDPGYQLGESRAFAAFKLKSTFEHIFAKYERDFTGIGDEIDLRTGKVIIDNGHIQSMRNEGDVGQIHSHERRDGDGDDEDEGILLSDLVGSDDSNDQGEEDEEQEMLILHGRRPTSALQTRSESNPNRPLASSVLTRDAHLFSGTPGQTPWGLGRSEPIDPAWRAPDLPSPATFGKPFASKFINTRYNFPAVDGFRSVWSSGGHEEEDVDPVPTQGSVLSMFRKRHELSRLPKPQVRKLLVAPDEDDDDEDEILGFTTDNQAENRQSAELHSDSHSLPKAPRPQRNQDGPIAEASGDDTSASQRDEVSESTQGGPLSNHTRAVSVSPKRRRRPPKDQHTRSISQHKPSSLKDTECTASHDCRSRAGLEASHPTSPKETSNTRLRRFEIVLRSRLLTPDGYIDVDDPENAASVAHPEPDTRGTTPLPTPCYNPTKPSIPDSRGTSPNSGPKKNGENAGSSASSTPREPSDELEIGASLDLSGDEDALPATGPFTVRKPPSTVGREVPIVEPYSDMMPRLRNRRKRKHALSSSPCNTRVYETAQLLSSDSHSQKPATETSPNSRFAIDHTTKSSPGNKTVSLPVRTAHPTSKNLVEQKQSPENVTRVGATPLTAPETTGSTAPESITRDNGHGAQKGHAVIEVHKACERKYSKGSEAARAQTSEEVRFENKGPRKNSDAVAGTEQGQGATSPSPSKTKQMQTVKQIASDACHDQLASPLTKIPDSGSSGGMFHELAAISARCIKGRTGEGEGEAVPEALVTEEAGIITRCGNVAPGSPVLPEPPTGDMDAEVVEAGEPSTPPTLPTLRAAPASLRSANVRRGLLALRPDDKYDTADEITQPFLSSPVKKRPAPPSIGRPGSSDDLLISARRQDLTRPKRVVGNVTPRKPSSIFSSGHDELGVHSKTIRVAREGFGGLRTPTKSKNAFRESSPTGSIILTPGGHTRRCGVDGFCCERDFCFICLGG